MLELALKQTGPACVKRAADYAQRAAAAEGSNAGIIKASPYARSLAAVAGLLC